MADEVDDALALADRILDQHYRDPDDDMSMLARQLIRQRESYLRYKQALERANGFLIMNNLAPVKLEYASTENLRSPLPAGVRIGRE